MSASKTPTAVIFGCAGPSLTAAERTFFVETNPLGFILFARNVFKRSQVCALVDELRATVGRHAPILIDQEGGRVQRLKSPNWPNRPPMALFGLLADRNVALGRKAVRLNARLIAQDLLDMGIDVDCAPVLDVPVQGAHDIIGDRAFGSDPMLVADLGRAAVDGFLDGGVMPVVKHVPGHGRARVDSHTDLPVVDETRDVLELTDFVPFRSLRDAPWAMTAHVVYRQIDDRLPATLSPIVIKEIIRGFIGFDGVLLSDDLSMDALKGDYEERAHLALTAGCDVVLHCNGKMDEMRAVARGVTLLTDVAQERIARAKAMLRRQAVPSNAAANLDAMLRGDVL